MIEASLATLLLGWTLWGQGASAPINMQPPTNAEMRTIAERAVTFAKLENTQSGVAGLIGDVKACYAGLGGRPSSANAAYCLALDTAAAKLAGIGGDDLAPDYFKAKARAPRQAKLVARAAPAEARNDFVQKLDEAELAAEAALTPPPRQGWR